MMLKLGFLKNSTNVTESVQNYALEGFNLNSTKTKLTFTSKVNTSKPENTTTTQVGKFIAENEQIEIFRIDLKFNSTSSLSD